MIKEFFLNDQKMLGFFVGAFFAVAVIYLSRSVSQDPAKALLGKNPDCVTTCADRKAFDRWPMANQQEVAFGEGLKKKYGEKVVK